MEREEAIRRIKAWNLDSDDMEVLSVVVPELAESEDERMVRKIESFLSAYGADYFIPSELQEIEVWLEKHREQKPIIQDVELNDAVYDYVEDHFIAGADFTPEYIKKLMENAFFAGVDYYLLKQESGSCESDTNVEKVIEDVIRVYGKTQGECVGGYDVDTLIVNLRRAFNKKGQKPAEWSEEDEKMLRRIIGHLTSFIYPNSLYGEDAKECIAWLKSQPHWKPSKEQMDTLQTLVKMSGTLRMLYNDLKKLL